MGARLRRFRLLNNQGNAGVGSRESGVRDRFSHRGTEARRGRVVAKARSSPRIFLCASVPLREIFATTWRDSLTLRLPAKTLVGLRPPLAGYGKRARPRCLPADRQWASPRCARSDSQTRPSRPGSRSAARSAAGRGPAGLSSRVGSPRRLICSSRRRRGGEGMGSRFKVPSRGSGASSQGPVFKET